MSNNVEEENVKRIKFLEYLLKVTQVNRNIAKYIQKDYGEENILWFSDIAEASNCTLTDWASISGEILKVRHKAEPLRPTTPAECNKWIEIEENNNLPPKLKDSIFEETEFGEIRKKLADNPKVKIIFDKYIEERWKIWKDEYDKWKQEENYYQKLFAIRQTLNKNKEQYELVLGLGFLQYKDQNDAIITRHLLVSKIELELLAEKSEFVVRFPLGVGNLYPEFEMIEDNVSRETEEKIKLLLDEDNSLTQENLDKILKIALHTLFADGEYDSTLERLQNITEKHVVTFSPAIILRERPPIGFKKALEDISHQIEEGREVSSLFRDLTSINYSSARVTETENYKNTLFDTEELFFPKPCNEEQEKIIHRIKYANGIVVQGPPGTGKSHTIANLICHLLATGNRILVTAKTPTALNVLRDKIPDQLKNLVISLLGSSIEEKNLLENSVNSILTKSSSWDNAAIEIQLKKIVKNLDKLRREKAEKERELKDLIESETAVLSVVNKRYNGTASRIVQRINKESEEYSWFKDEISPDTYFDLSTEEMLQILKGMKELYPIKDELSQNFEEVALTSENFKSLVKELTSLSDSDLQDLENHILFRKLCGLSIEELTSIFQKICVFEDTKKEVLSQYNEDWVKAEFEKIDEDNEKNYKEIVEQINTCISEIRSVEKIAKDYQVEYSSELTPKGIYDDAKIFKEYLEKKNSSNLFSIFYRVRDIFSVDPRIEKCAYIFEKVKINGRLCQKIVEDLDILINFFRYHYNVDKLKAYVSDFVETPETIKLREAERISKILTEIAKAISSLFDIKSFEILKYIRSSVSELNNIRKICCYGVIYKLKNQLHTLQINSHPIKSQLLNAIVQRDVDKYRKTKFHLDSLIKKRNDLAKLEREVSQVKKIIPLTINEMICSYEDDAWIDRIKQHLEKAWYWSQAKTWAKNYNCKDNLQEISDYLKDIEERIKENIGKLAELRAWNFCIKRLTPQQKEHAELWKQALKKLGKGTGKYANKHRKSAQEHLEGCREAIPAWIMPLYSVWDNISAAPEIFDVIIVDEASQCGIDALPLLYFAKKILIVGDDEQISPENVGLDRSKTNQLMNEYLSDFSVFKDRFDCDNSLFDVGNAIFNSSKIVLREHFRCMPEIIKFSNDLCYSNTPLIPLKQYGSNSLLPLENVFIAEGYREGKGERVINRPEADAITDRIEQMCADKKYSDKSIGVIVLQGRAQAEVIQKQLSQRLSAEQYEKHEIICGVPSQFQGNEKDIILLSMVAAPNVQFTALTKKTDKQRFNVAMSRAKEQVILFHSVKVSDLSPLCLRRSLLEFFINKKENSVNGISKEELEKVAYQSKGKRNDTKTPKGFDSWFEVDVALEIMNKGYQILSQYEVAGKRIDIVVVGGHSRLAVECDGDYWHNRDSYEDDMRRQRQLERCGWEFFRIRESSFYYDKEQSLQKLWEVLEIKGIKPRQLSTLH